MAGTRRAPASTAATPWLAIVDGDDALQRVLELRLDHAGWGHARLALPPSPDDLIAMRLAALLIDLDLGLAAGERWNYLELVASALPGLAIVVVSRPWPVADRVRALRAGADDWVAKPCHPDELFARICAAVRARRTGPQALGASVTAGELELQRHRYAALAAGHDLELTRREFELLALLVDAGDDVVEREAIYRSVWGYEMARGDRSVDVFVRRLRRKLDHASPGWRYVHTHFGVGYSFRPEPVRPSAQPPAPGSGARVRAPALSR